MGEQRLRAAADVNHTRGVEPNRLGGLRCGSLALVGSRVAAAPRKENGDNGRRGKDDSRPHLTSYVHSRACGPDRSTLVTPPQSRSPRCVAVRKLRTGQFSFWPTDSKSSSRGIAAAWATERKCSTVPDIESWPRGEPTRHVCSLLGWLVCFRPVITTLTVIQGEERVADLPTSDRSGNQLERGALATPAFTKLEAHRAAKGDRPSLLLRTNEGPKRQRAVRGRVGDDPEVRRRAMRVPRCSDWRSLDSCRPGPLHPRARAAV